MGIAFSRLRFFPFSFFEPRVEEVTVFECCAT